MPAYLYILLLKSGALYIGTTKNLEKCYERHISGTGDGTRLEDPPVSLIYSEEHKSFSNARKRKAQIKRWTRAKKEALVAGDIDKLREHSESRK